MKLINTGQQRVKSMPRNYSEPMAYSLHRNPAMKFHRGEQEVQKRAGGQQEAARNGAGIRAQIPLPAFYFLQQRQFAFAGFTDKSGKVWCSILTGEPGFVQAAGTDRITIQLNASADPLLLQHLGVEQDLGLLVIDFATRRRMRFNGRAQLDDGRIVLRTHEVFGNCPRCIQMRTIVESKETASSPHDSSTSETLAPAQMELIKNSDTFFIATSFAETGADVSHRGGMPGFVQVLGASLIAWPDYDGNKMFQTLGNLTMNPAAGLLFMDFNSGDTVQLTGATQVLWEGETIQNFPGAQRVIRFQIERVIATAGAAPFTWKFLEYSPFNPEQK